METNKTTGVQPALIVIQTKLKAPKSQYNSFGKYKYRSAEDILEAVKPLLGEQGVLLTLSDDIIEVSGRFYVKATATAAKDGESVSNTAFAREDDTKKGMDGSQITGTASSYARKYALNGLFLIDDTKDADTDEYQRQTDKKGTKAANAMKKAVAEVQAVKNRAELRDVWDKWKEQCIDICEVGSDFYNAIVEAGKKLSEA
jgi:hypothetical protein